MKCPLNFKATCSSHKSFSAKEDVLSQGKPAKRCWRCSKLHSTLPTPSYSNLQHTQLLFFHGGCLDSLVGLLSIVGHAASSTAHCAAQAGKHDGQGHPVEYE